MKVFVFLAVVVVVHTAPATVTQVKNNSTTLQEKSNNSTDYAAWAGDTEKWDLVEESNWTNIAEVPEKETQWTFDEETKWTNDDDDKPLAFDDFEDGDEFNEHFWNECTVPGWERCRGDRCWEEHGCRRQRSRRCRWTDCEFRHHRCHSHDHDCFRHTCRRKVCF
uniref:Uncharacterized protein n=1 Tax=Plectus sambesii TaxID=2011161 RepID=A0A914WZ93_9BILA